MGATFYQLNRHHLSDIPLSRWIQIILLGGAVLAILMKFSGYWIVVGLLIGAFIAFTAMSIYWRQRHYLHFIEKSAPPVSPVALKPADKLPIISSGDFDVEGKQANFTWLQGYFRTFATREHAVLCLVQPSRFALLGQWPEKEVGMWYVFFKDDEVEAIRWGEIHYGGKKLSGLAIEYRVFIPKQKRFERDRFQRRKVYIGCEQEEDTRRILADLHYNKNQSTLGDVSKQNGNGRLPENAENWRRISG